MSYDIITTIRYMGNKNRLLDDEQLMIIQIPLVRDDVYGWGIILKLDKRYTIEELLDQ